MDSPGFDNLDAAGFLETWQRFDADDNGYIEGKELDDFFLHLLKKLGTEDDLSAGKVQKIKERFMSVYDVTADGRLQIQEVKIFASGCHFISWLSYPVRILCYLLQFWRKYDADSSGYISASELRNFLRDLFIQHKKVIAEPKLDEYTDTMMKFFDRNKNGRLDLNDLARSACSVEDRRRDFEEIFKHYDVSKTGALEGPEVDGFVKDMMELVKPSIRGVDLDKLREILLRHCDVNQDGKIQKSELALCLGLKLNQ
uniref:Secretagogin n=1 Tax=Callorhinchus milii TaxID=7868 RepID=A0A4W3ILC8_CALMI